MATLRRTKDFWNGGINFPVSAMVDPCSSFHAQQQQCNSHASPVGPHQLDLLPVPPDSSTKVPTASSRKPCGKLKVPSNQPARKCKQQIGSPTNCDTSISSVCAVCLVFSRTYLLDLTKLVVVGWVAVDPVKQTRRKTTYFIRITMR